MGTRRPRRRRAAASALGLAVLAGLLSAPPVRAAVRVDRPEMAPPQDPPGPVKPADRFPVAVPGPENGLRNPREADLVPGLAASPRAALGDARHRPKLGGPNYDVFGEGPGTEHYALVWPHDVNVRDEQGRWVKAARRLAKAEGGWSADLESSEVFLPAEMGPDPVLFTLPEGSLETQPLGVAPTPGELSDEAIVYRDAAPRVDLRYSLTPYGFKEEVILKGPKAPSSFSYEIRARGLSLVEGEGGQVLIMSGDLEVGLIPTPVAYDAAYEETVPETVLTEIGPNLYRLEVSLDPDFLEGASYPVVLDPAEASRYPKRDAYVNNSNPGTSYEGGQLLKVGSGKRTFMRFETSGIQKEERIVYSAQAALWIVAQGQRWENVNAKRVTSSWPGTLTWNSQPSVDTAVPGSGNGPLNDWMYIELKKLYQNYLDTSWWDRGFRLASSDNKTFYSDEAGGNARPQLLLAWNDLPASPGLDLPSPDAVVETTSPALKLAFSPGQIWDPNGDEVLVQFQVSDDPDNFGGDHLKYSSPWVDTTWHTVPAGALTDGQTYYWRARSWDVCQPPDGMCPLKDGTGEVREQNTSGVRKFTVSLKHLGDDPRYAMWSRDLGNHMTMKVNQSNGNLFLDVPLDVLATPVDDLAISLTYNHQLADDSGLGAGWQLSAGPASARRDLPTRLDDQGGKGIKMWFRDGGVRYFHKRNDRTYGGFGSGAGVVKKNNDGTYRYETTEGGSFTFKSGGWLDAARPAGASDAYQGVAFDYTFDAAEHLTKVTDALGREVTFTWSAVDPAANLESIQTWDGRTWDLETYPSGSLGAIVNPASERVEFLYSDDRLSEIRNGEMTTGTSWLIAYSSIGGIDRVIQVRPPDAPTDAYWSFSYPGPFKGTTSGQAILTDPRGTQTPTEDDYTAITDFNWAGLPVRTAGPADASGNWPITTQLWDANNNLLCKRSPAANAAEEHCTATSGSEDPLSTIYTYQEEEPNRLLTVTHPAPDPEGSGERASESYAYDQGSEYNALWLERFENPQLRGEPVLEGLWDDMDRGWGSGSPFGIGPVDNWSLRWTGFLDIDAAQTKRYGFRVWSDDGVTLSVGGATLLDCFGQSISSNIKNCESGEDVATWLAPGLQPITIEFQEKTGTASFTLKWDKGNGEWAVPSTPVLRAGRGLLTTKTSPTLATTYLYPTDDHRARRLPSEETASETQGPGDRTTTYTYDEFGRPLDVTTAAGTAQEATTTSSYLDPVTGEETACLRQTTGPTGAVTDLECNAAGDVTSETLHVRQVGPQPAQDRTTTIQYDPLGRPTRVEGPSGEVTETDYDLAGRPTETRMLLDDAGTPDPGDDVWATATSEYDERGRLITETLPDPDGGGPDPAPVINYTYDQVGNRLTRSDPRNAAWTWEMTYDASNRILSETSPSGLTTAMEYVLTPEDPGTQGTEWESKEITTAPTGVATTISHDVLGRKTKEKTGTLTTTTYAYDVVGNVIKVTDPAGVWTEQDYDGFGQVIEERTPAQGGGGHATTFTYDPAGNLAQADGPRAPASGEEDILEYAYDLAGRLTSSTYALDPADSQDDLTTTFLYDDAGERIRVTGPDGRVREWTYDLSGREQGVTVAPGTSDEQAWSHLYDEGGRLLETSDPRGITLHRSYDRAGNLTRRWGTDGGQETDAESFTYDAAGNMTEALREAAGAEPALATTLEYDPDGRLTRVAQGGEETTYAYFGNGEAAPGQLKEVTTPAGTTSYAWNPGTGLLDALTDPLTGLPTTYTYDLGGRPETRSTGSLTWTRTYQGATGRIASQEVASGAQTVASFELGYDEAGNVTSKDSYVEGLSSSEQGEWTYSYDGAGRMTASTDPSGETTTYGWDGAGNRTAVKVGTSPEEVTTYDQAGLPVSATGGITYTHDDAGNLIGIDRSGDADDLALDYDAWGRTTLQVPGTSDPASFELDALDRVVARTQGTAETAYHYAGEGESPAKVSLTGAAETLFAHAPSGPLAQQVGTGDARLLISDLHTDVVGLADPSGTAQGARSFSPWGEVRESGMDSVLGYQGDLTDPGSGLVDMGTRLYAPSLGRFTTRDVVFGDSTAPISLNQYAYGVGSPLTHLDPTGMCPPQYCFDAGYHGVKTRSGGHKSGHSPEYARYLVPTQTQVTAGRDPKTRVSRLRRDPPRPEARPTAVHFQIPVSPRHGEVWGGAFIEQDNNFTLAGDDRGFDPEASADQFRIFVKLNYRKGFGTVRVNPTCRAADPMDCESARSIVFGVSNNLDIRVGEDGSVLLDMAAKNSVIGLAPHINSSLLIVPQRGSNRVRGALAADGYPAWELYQSAGGRRRTLVQDTGTVAGPLLGLQPYLFTRFKGF